LIWRIRHSPGACDPQSADAGQLRFAAELNTACLGGLPAILRPLYDALALVLSKGAQERQDALAHGAGQIQVRFVETLHQGSKTGSCSPYKNPTEIGR
jgi:hypothetical protein